MNTGSSWYIYALKQFKCKNVRRSSKALDLGRVSWLQYSQFSFSIRNISDNVNYSTLSFNTRFEFFIWPIPDKTVNDTQICELKVQTIRYTWKNVLEKDFIVTKKNFLVPFCGWGSTNSRQLRGDSLLFPTNYSETPGAHLIDVRDMKD